MIDLADSLVIELRFLQSATTMVGNDFDNTQTSGATFIVIAKPNWILGESTNSKNESMNFSVNRKTRSETD